MQVVRGRCARLFGGILVAVGAVTAIGAIGVTPAAAATGKKLPINTTCLGFFINNDGTTGGAVPPEKDFPLPITVAAVGGPTEVFAGASFNGVAGSVQVPIPGLVDTKITDSGIGIGGGGVVKVYAAANVTETIKVVGAASIGTPSVSGGNLVGATATKVGADKVRVVFPGTHSTNTGSTGNFEDLTHPGNPIPGDENDFDPDSNFTSPTLTIPVTAGAAGSTVKFVMTGHTIPSAGGQTFPDYGDFKVDSDVDAFDNFGHVIVRAYCDPNNLVIGQVQVVAPPPPGAPDAVADVAQTDAGKAVTVDVLANDVQGQIDGVPQDIDTSSLAVTTAPKHGSTSVTSDHKITYTPAAGFTGTDTFTYKLCSVIGGTTTTTVQLTDVPQAAVAPCDTAIVTVTVLEGQVVVKAPPPTTTSTTVAQLPRTGTSSSTPLALAGFGLCALGFAVLRIASRRRASI